MAEPEAQPPIQTVQENDEKKLNSALYEYAKENSGPLKPGVETVEGTVKAVIGPVYDKFQDVPFQLLKFVDRKVDESITELDRHVPALLKEIAYQATAAAQKAPEVAHELAAEVQRDSLLDTATNIAKSLYAKYEPAAKELYTEYEPIAEKYAVSAWRLLNRLPLFLQVADVMIPTAAYWAEKYNQAVAYTAEKGYPLSYYLPLVPIERIAKIFEGAENEPVVSTNGEYVAVSE
ncbi:unnamed protein product [Fraxinus pennsylvanica]|uniref:Small rubber particle protein n=1 Tax=Fraxinus pennsylvanica TaxID=56036 RepID=A0AAD1ZZ73_9LAMI|nr:unnamed protein product [Fraxinus pennsylvanica]